VEAARGAASVEATDPGQPAVCRNQSGNHHTEDPCAVGKKPVNGHCRACGTLAALSWEHVPPRVSPNKNTHIELTFEQAIRLGPDDIPKGPQGQGGVQFPTLCGRCNNKFGWLYVPSLNE
jgi:hypothetical protein